MPPADPSLVLINPYAGGEPDTPSGRSARAAGRVLAVGALGLGAVALFTGTAAADEADDDSDRTSEFAADGTAAEESSDGDGQDAGTDDAPDGADGAGETQDPSDAADTADSDATDPDADTADTADSDSDSDSVSADTGSSTPTVVEEEPEGGSDPQDEADAQPASDTAGDEPTGADDDGDAQRGSDGEPVPADAPVPPDADDPDEQPEEDGDGVAAEVLVASAGTPEPGASEAEERPDQDGDEVLVASAATPEPRPSETDEPGSDAEPARFDTGAADGFRIDEDVPLPSSDAEDVGFAQGPAFEESTGGGGDLFRTADGLADLFENGTVEIEGLGTVEIAPLAERLRDVEVRDGSGGSVRIGDVVDRFRPDAPDLPVVRLPQDVRDAIDARRTREAGAADERIDATVGTPRSVQIAPGVTVTGPRVDTGSARLDLDLDDGRIGVTGLGSDLGRVRVQGSGTAPLDDRGGSRVQGTTSTTVTLDPQTGRTVHLPGAPGDPADAPERLTVRTTNLGTLSTGTPPPGAQPTGDRTARWAALSAGAGLDGTVALVNGEDSVVASGTAATPLSVSARAGENSPGSRWDADLTGTLTPQVTFGPTGSDTRTTTSVTGRVGGEIGDRRNAAGNFAGDTDGDGRGSGAVVGGGLSGRYTATDSGLLTVPGTTRQVGADTTGYRVGGDLGFELREDRPRFEAGIEGTVAAGVQGSSVTTATSSSSTGPSPFVNARLAGDVEVATAPRGQDRAYARVDGSARYDLADGRSSSAVQITPRVGGEIGLGGTTTLGGDLGYQLGVTDDATNGTRDDSGLVAGVSTGFNAFGGRSDVGLTYDGADPAGGESVAVKVAFTPGAARETPRPAADPVRLPPPPAPVGTGLDPAGPSVPAPLPSAWTAPVPPAVAPEVREPGPLVDGASALAGTTPVGIDLGSTAPVVTPTPTPIPVEVVPPTAPAVDPGASGGGTALDVSLNEPVVDLPAVEPAALVPATAPVEVASTGDVPVSQPEPLPLPEPLSLPEPLPSALTLPDLVASPAFSMDDVSGFDSSAALPGDAFSLSDTSFLDSGSSAFGGGLF
jgi:hypothetical protein